MSVVPSVPRLTPHAPLGAGASFDFGLPGQPACFRLNETTALPTDFIVGCRHSVTEPWNLLPFFAPSFTGPQPLPKGRFGRFLGWAGDKWMIGPLVFKICTPFETQPDLTDACFRYAPLVCGYLEYDNTHSDDAVELVFGFGGDAKSLSLCGAAGFASDAAYGYATAASAEVDVRHGSAIFGTEMGPATALHFSVPARSKRVYPLVIGFYPAPTYAAGLFPNLAAVLAYGLAQHARYLAVAEARDAELMRSPLQLEARASAAHNVRAWLAQSRRLSGAPEIDLSGLLSLVRAVTC